MRDFVSGILIDHSGSLNNYEDLSLSSFLFVGNGVEVKPESSFINYTGGVFTTNTSPDCDHDFMIVDEGGLFDNYGEMNID